MTWQKQVAIIKPYFLPSDLKLYCTEYSTKPIKYRSLHSWYLGHLAWTVDINYVPVEYVMFAHVTNPVKHAKEICGSSDVNEPLNYCQFSAKGACTPLDCHLQKPPNNIYVLNRRLGPAPMQSN